MLTKIGFFFYNNNVIKNITNLIGDCQSNNTCSNNHCIKLDCILHFYQYSVTVG